MSSGPTLTGETCIQSTKRKYINIKFTKNDWCTYKGHCRIDDVLGDKLTTCMICVYCKKLSIPQILKEK